MSKSRKALADGIGRHAECEDDFSPRVPVFQTGSREEMIEYARQTSLNSLVEDKDLDDKPKAAIQTGNAAQK